MVTSMAHTSPPWPVLRPGGEESLRSKDGEEAGGNLGEGSDGGGTR